MGGGVRAVEESAAAFTPQPLAATKHEPEFRQQITFF
jgi:hypothetical protein